MGQIELFDYLNWGQTNDLCEIELFEIELFDHLIDWCLIELIVIDSNIWNHLTLLTNAKLNCLK